MNRQGRRLIPPFFRINNNMVLHVSLVVSWQNLKVTGHTKTSTMLVCISSFPLDWRNRTLSLLQKKHRGTNGASWNFGTYLRHRFVMIATGSAIKHQKTLPALDLVVQISRELGMEAWWTDQITWMISHVFVCIPCGTQTNNNFCWKRLAIISEHRNKDWDAPKLFVYSWKMPQQTTEDKFSAKTTTTWYSREPDKNQPTQTVCHGLNYSVRLPSRRPEHFWEWTFAPSMRHQLYGPPGLQSSVSNKLSIPVIFFVGTTFFHH